MKYEVEDSGPVTREKVERVIRVRFEGKHVVTLGRGLVLPPNVALFEPEAYIEEWNRKFEREAFEALYRYIGRNINEDGTIKGELMQRVWIEPGDAP